ncbi:MAG: ABC transporter ATP-binding protein, partial [Pseudomonadota bacterium]
MTELSTSAPILAVRGLRVAFGFGADATVVVENLSYDLPSNRTLAIVGESGSGKSVSALALLGLVRHLGGRIKSGTIGFRSEVLSGVVDLAHADEAQLRTIRGNEIAMIFQEPMTSLNPVFTIGSQIVEAITLHQHIGRNQAWKRALELMDLVRLPNGEHTLRSYPHQLSGGMRQRAMIAMALSCRPRVLVADEPTTALDVTIQAQILTIIRDLQREFETAVIFISHDMGVVAEMADDVLVMRNGCAVEFAPVTQIFAAPTADYTKALLHAV